MPGARIPLISLRTWRSDPPLFVSQLRDASRTVGFFLLEHDLPPGVAESALSEARQFFARPREAKESIRYEDTGGTFRGYIRPGAENTAGRIDWREQVEYGTESSPSPSHGHPPARKRWPPYERLRGPNPWPDEHQPTLRPAMERYVRGALGVAKSLREALCMGIGLEKNALDGAFDDGLGPYWQLKLVSYPPPPHDGDVHVGGGDSVNDEKEPWSQGVGAHTDSNFLTFVLQDGAWDGVARDGASGCGGLQVFSPVDHEWVDVPSSLGPDVLICNLGEQAEITSGGYYRATPHRVVVPRNPGHPRTSVPFFYNPDLKVRLEALPGLEQEDSALNNDDKARWRAEGKNRMMGTVGENLLKSLARSHPAVFRRYHSDLQVLDDGQVVSSLQKGEEK